MLHGTVPRLAFARFGWRISGQNSRVTLIPASTLKVIPAEPKPLATVCSLAGIHRREMRPLPIAPETSPDAKVFLPVVVFRVTTVRSNAYFTRGPKPCLPDG